MKFLILIGSYRKHGNTDQIAGLIAEQLVREGQHTVQPVEIETVYLGHEEIQPCRGCRVCFDRGEERCPLKDDLASIKAKMQAADGVLVACPVYVDDVNGITKNWIDRLAHVCHRPEFAGRSAYLVVTVGGSPCGHALGTLEMAMSLWGFHIAGKAGLKTGALLKPDEMKTQFQEKVTQIGHDFFQAVYQRQSAQPSFRALITFKVQQLAWQRVMVKDSVDYRYWSAQGWLDPRCTFYIPHQANPVKVRVARWVGAVIARFVS